MVLRGTGSGTSYIISLKTESVAISVNNVTVAAWDRGGRLYSLYGNGVTHRRGLDGHVLVKRDKAGERVYQRLAGAEAGAVVDAAAAIARSALGAIRAPGWRWAGRVDAITSQEAATLLNLCGDFSSDTARADADRFARVYRPIGMLPPDQYLSLVVQATEGCSFNTCTFCDLYHEPYRVKTPNEFASHVSAVQAYLGESITLRSRGIFLGSANALAVPMPRLVPLFELLAEHLDAIRLGVYAFVDAFTGGLKHSRDYRRLNHLGLRRVYLGLESGHDPLRACVRKPGSSAAAIDTVRALKAAGVQVGVIVMIGLGGERFVAGHVADTIKAVNAMDLDAGDVVYFSDLVDMPDTAYPALAGEMRLSPLNAGERHAQRNTIRSGLQFARSSPQISNYDVRAFVY
jgi:hypothetical protein